MPSEIDKSTQPSAHKHWEIGTQVTCNDVHGTIAALCLQYILAVFREQDDPLDFLDFTCFHWTVHARQAGGLPSVHLYVLVKSLFLQEQDYASWWLSKVANTQAARFALLPLNAEIAFVFAAFDLSSRFGKMFGVSVGSPESTDQEKRTPLHLAAANNSFSPVRWIQSVLSAADKTLGDLATRKDSKGESPISLAAQNGHGKNYGATFGINQIQIRV